MVRARGVLRKSRYTVVRGARTAVTALLAGALLVSPAAADPPIVVCRGAQVLADSVLRGGDKNTNEGANPVLSISGTGNTRIVLYFGLKGLPASAVVLRLTVADNPGSWGEGKFISVHPLLEPFTEGNGMAWGLAPPDQVRGSGGGVTWNCPIDANIANQAANCPEGWAGGEIGAVLDSVLITNETTGAIAFDVTSYYNSLAPSAPILLLVKKDNDGAPGRVDFHSKESTAPLCETPTLFLEFGTPV